jgi:hypothetical protein
MGECPIPEICILDTVIVVDVGGSSLYWGSRPYLILYVSLLEIAAEGGSGPSAMERERGEGRLVAAPSVSCR